MDRLTFVLAAPSVQPPVPRERSRVFGAAIHVDHGRDAPRVVLVVDRAVVDVRALAVVGVIVAQLPPSTASKGIDRAAIVRVDQRVRRATADLRQAQRAQYRTFRRGA